MFAKDERRSRLSACAVLAFAAIIAAFLGVSAAQNAPAPRTAVVLDIEGPVTPANAQYLAREIGKASSAGKELIVIEIDTPGGLVDSMKTIIKAILASQTPVVTYVSPQGARSASAGLYIMYAAHVSAMAPNTNTGAATPVELGGAPSDENPFEKERPGTQKPSDPEPASDGGAPANAGETQDAAPGAADNAEQAAPLGNADALRAKIMNDSVAYIRSLAEERGRNADWAEKAVRQAASVTSREALELGVIDLIADDLDDLLVRIDGLAVNTVAGEKVVATKNIAIERIAPTFIEKILGFIADPNVAVILMSLATTGIIIEMWNPGSIFPGAVGALCLVLGLYAFQVLPFNWLGAVLMGVGAILILVEMFTPTFGLSGLAGLVVFASGMYLIFPEGFRVSTGLILTVVGAFGAFLALVFIAVVGSRSHGPMIGAEAIRRREGVVDDWDGKDGWVIIEGERWRARADKPLQKGDKVKVVEIDGLVLVVKQAKAPGLLGAIQPKEA
ncbi:MAG: NfeD family protein [Parvularculaceae bacterium]|nr:hypothetical protein [Parvularculaceae bacterium]